jgi:alkylation response protein AidB-like acyl-CoA dehydrogenase
VGVSRLLSDEHKELQGRARRFAREIVGPRRLEAFENPPFLREMSLLAGAEGFLRVMTPRSLGGTEMGTMGGVLVVEEIARESPAVAISVMLQMMFPQAMLASKAATELWYEGALAGKIALGSAFTDPIGIVNYGEHPDIAIGSGDGFILNGVRQYVTQAIFADVICVGGLVDGDMWTFWLPTDQPGVTITPMPKMGMGAPWGRIELADVRVPRELAVEASAMVKDRRLAGLDGEQAGSTHFISALSLGLASGVLEKTEAYLRERTVEGEPLAAMQALQHKLARMRQNVEVGRSALYDAAQLVDAGQPDLILDHVIKPYIAEMAVDVARECVSLHGGRGYLRAAGIELYLRDAVGGMIGECTSEMHYSTVAYLMDLPGAKPGAF